MPGQPVPQGSKEPALPAPRPPLPRGEPPTAAGNCPGTEITRGVFPSCQPGKNLPPAGTGKRLSQGRCPCSVSPGQAAGQQGLRPGPPACPDADTEGASAAGWGRSQGFSRAWSPGQDLAGVQEIRLGVTKGTGQRDLGPVSVVWGIRSSVLCPKAAPWGFSLVFCGRSQEPIRPHHEGKGHLGSRARCLHSFIHSLIPSLTHALIHSFIHSCTLALIPSLIH